VVLTSVAILVFFKPNLVYFAIVWFIFFSIWFIVYFFIFGLFLLFLKMFQARYQLSRNNIRVCLVLALENASKLLDSLIFSNSLLQHIVVSTGTGVLQPFTCRVVNFLKARPYLSQFQFVRASAG